MSLVNNWKSADYDLAAFSAWDGDTAAASVAQDFSIEITPNAGAAVTSATINFGESGDTAEALTASTNTYSITGQTYSAAGTYQIQIIATFADGTTQEHFEQCVVSA